MPPAETVLWLSFVALAAATISGLIGMGGGILLLAAMVLSGIPPHVLIGTRLLRRVPESGWRLVFRTVLGLTGARLLLDPVLERLLG